MKVLPDNHFIFAFVPLSGGKINIKQPLFKIFITDKDLKIVNKFFNYEEKDYEFIGKRTYFSSMGDGVILVLWALMISVSFMERILSEVSQ